MTDVTAARSTNIATATEPYDTQSDTQPDAQPDVQPGKYGFIIYRTDYNYDKRWEVFMRYLNVQVETGMRSEEMGHDISNIDRKVQSSPDLSDASFDKIRR